mgnify:CR=1 FL=1
MSSTLARTFCCESECETNSTSLETLSLSENVNPLSNPRTPYLKCRPMFSILALWAGSGLEVRVQMLMR